METSSSSNGAAEAASTLPESAPAALPSLPQSLFDRIVQQQWTAISSKDDLSPYLPLLADWVELAINGSSSAAGLLSEPGTAALLRLTSAYRQLKDINQYSNCNITQAWKSAAAASSPEPPPLSPAAFESLSHADRILTVLQQLRRLQQQQTQQAHQQGRREAALSSWLFSPGFSPHLGLIVPLCLRHCAGFLPVKELTALLLQIAPPCNELITACIRNAPQHSGRVIEAVVVAARNGWLTWIAASPAAAAAVPPQLANVALLLHQISSLSPSLSLAIRSAWLSKLAAVLALPQLRDALQHRLSPSPALPRPVSAGLSYAAELPLSLTVYFIKDTAAFLSSLYEPSPPAPLSSAVVRLLLSCIAEHPALVRGKAEAAEERRPPPAAVGSKGAADSREESKPASTAAAAPQLVRTNSSPLTAAAASPSSQSKTQPQQQQQAATVAPVHAAPAAPAAAAAAGTAAASPPCFSLIRRHLSKSLHQLCLQRSRLLFPAVPGPPSTPSSASLPPTTLSDNSRQGVALLRLYCGLSGVSGWQVEAADADNALFLDCPQRGGDISPLDDGELLRAGLCFALLCRPRSQLSPWRAEDQLMRLVMQAAQSRAAAAFAAAVDLLLLLHLAFARPRVTDSLLPELLSSALSLRIAHVDAAALTALRETALASRPHFSALLLAALRMQPSSEAAVACRLQCLHWMLVHDAVDAAQAPLCSFWLCSLMRRAAAPEASSCSFPPSLLLSPLFLSVLELTGLLCVDGGWHSGRLDDRLMTERELRLALQLPQTAALLPPVASSPAASFTSGSSIASSSVTAAHHWLLAVLPSLPSSLCSFLSCAYYVCYYDLLCYNSRSSCTASLRQPRSPQQQQPAARFPYAFSLLLSLPVPLLLRLSEAAEDALRLLHTVIAHRLPFFSLSASTFFSAVQTAADVAAPAQLPAAPALDACGLLAQLKAVCSGARAEAQQAELAALLSQVEAAVRQQLLQSSWQRGLSCLQLVDALLHDALPLLLDASAEAAALSSFVVAGLLLAESLGPTFCCSLLQAMGQQGQPASASPPLLLLLQQPERLLDAAPVRIELFPLQLFCFASLLLASRCYLSCQQQLAAAADEREADGAEDEGDGRQRKKHRRDKLGHTAAAGGADGAEAAEGSGRGDREELQPVKTRRLQRKERERERLQAVGRNDEATATAQTTRPLSVQSGSECETQQQRLLRESERRHRKKFPFSLEEEKQAAAAGGDYHSLYQRLADSGREQLTIGDSAADAAGSSSSSRLFTQLQLAQELKVLETVIGRLSASWAHWRSSEGRKAQPEAEQSAQQLPWQARLRDAAEEKEAATRSSLWAEVQRRWEGSEDWRRLVQPSRLLCPPGCAVYPAFVAVAGLLSALVAQSPLLLRLLLYRTLPADVLPSLLILAPLLSSLSVPALPLLLAAPSLAVQTFALRLLVCLHRSPHLTNRLRRKLASASLALMPALIRPDTGWSRRCEPELLLLLAAEHQQHEESLLRLLLHRHAARQEESTGLSAAVKEQEEVKELQPLSSEQPAQPVADCCAQ